ncbi:LptA/OstA family protein [Pseudanabaena sp. FACHB-2040]|uniref:LptA/OstA family protein n=1 Tax=Pseudanabaena sp. FACHB-2040 TaxID=2692859 RepID=UPI00168438E0|nr:LptA/OstA family protein [Pseudanabaena sp. FACHB-2040]MBD2256859.1 hypothetical protein [Pseudanabaena sp. FACHB-2040]
MNSKDQSSELSQADSALLSQLSRAAEEIEPDSTFEAQLETKLLQARQSASRDTHQPKLPSRGLRRRAALVAYASLAIAAGLSITTITSGWLPEWVVSALTSTIDPQANAQTTAQLKETGQIFVRADAQEVNEETQEVRAIGNAAFIYPEAQIEANADEIRYVPTDQQIVLLGNVRISQRGEQLQGTSAICSIDKKQCRLSED